MPRSNTFFFGFFKLKIFIGRLCHRWWDNLYMLCLCGVVCAVLRCLYYSLFRWNLYEKKNINQHNGKIRLMNLMNSRASHNNNRSSSSSSKNDGDDEINVRTTLKLDSSRLINWLAFISCEQCESGMNLSTEYWNHVANQIFIAFYSFERWRETQQQKNHVHKYHRYWRTMKAYTSHGFQFSVQRLWCTVHFLVLRRHQETRFNVDIANISDTSLGMDWFFGEWKNLS